MRRILIFAGAIIAAILLLRFCEFKKGDAATLEQDTSLIQQQLVNVGKLVVTEGHFSQVLTYKDQQNYLMNLLSFQKKALLVVNADVSVSYDLHQMKYDIDKENKTITITNIPKEEIKINPDIKFYDVDQSSMNPFTGDDYNKINASVKKNMQAMIEKSTLKSNAKNRLVSELSKILILTNSMGWTLKYNGQTISGEEKLDSEIRG